MSISTEEVKIRVNKEVIFGNLCVPENSFGVVLFAHGSGSGRFSPRNNYVAEVLQARNFATLLVDLLTEEEEQIDLVTMGIRFDIPLLVDRLAKSLDWLKKNKKTGGLPIGYFGSSTGAAAALIAAARNPEDIKAVVSRGGRPDLAAESLSRVEAPTLLIVGGNDIPVIELNEIALKKLRCKKKLEIIPGATHLFEESGTLEQVAKLAADWFAHCFEQGKK